MKLYYSPGACSLAPHIAAREAGIAIEIEKVDLNSSPHRTETGRDFTEINPKGYVPALELDDGAVLTENIAVLFYLADQAPDSGLAPPAGSIERYRLLEWLAFISTELHKSFGPLFHAEDYGDKAIGAFRGKIEERLAFLDEHLTSGAFLTGETFTIADAYCFVIVDWSRAFDIDLAQWPNLAAYMKRVGDRPKVREAKAAEGKSKK